MGHSLDMQAGMFTLCVRTFELQERRQEEKGTSQETALGPTSISTGLLRIHLEFPSMISKALHDMVPCTTHKTRLIPSAFCCFISLHGLAAILLVESSQLQDSTPRSAPLWSFPTPSFLLSHPFSSFSFWGLNALTQISTTVHMTL